MNRLGDMDVASKGSKVCLDHFLVQYFSVNFHFLTNDKDYNSDIFTTSTIDDGLSFGGVKSYPSSNFSESILYTMSRRHVQVYIVTWSDQRHGWF